MRTGSSGSGGRCSRKRVDDDLVFSYGGWTTSSTAARLGEATGRYGGDHLALVPLCVAQSKADRAGLKKLENSRRSRLRTTNRSL